MRSLGGPGRDSTQVPGRRRLWESRALEIRDTVLEKYQGIRRTGLQQRVESRR